MKAGKVWGLTETLLSKPGFEIHRIEIEPGGYCSKHRHVHKYNAFFVESGDLDVEVWKNDYDLVDTTRLKAGELTVVSPGEFHRFKALTRVICFEIYWVEMPEVDIEREVCGGKHSKADS